MTKIRTLLTRIVLLILAVQILNLSVYGRDYHEPEHTNTLGEPNQIDSVVEYVAEIMLDYRNAFPENGTHNHQSHTQHQLKHGSIYMISFRKIFDGIASYREASSIRISSIKEYRYLFANEITPPPPKA